MSTLRRVRCADWKWRCITQGTVRTADPTDAREVSMRRIRYQVATSLDGYIAGPKGEADWIIMDPDIDFQAIFAQFDTVLIGRRTFEGMARGKKKPGAMPGMKTLVFSKTLRQQDYPKVTIVGENAEETVRSVRAESGK